MNGIVFNDVSFRYNQTKKEVSSMSFHIPKGIFCGIIGSNGSGKTTISLMINGLIPHHVSGVMHGDVNIDGINTRSQPVSFFSQKVGMVFQNPDFMIFNLSVKEEIGFGLSNLKMDKIPERIHHALSWVGLAGFENQDPHTLSLGQKQKLCLAAVLAMETEYIILDEPSAMLDYKSAVHLYKVLRELQKKGKTIIIIEHDTDFLYSFSNQIIVLDKGKLVSIGETEKIFQRKSILTQLGIKIPRKI